MWSSLVSFSLAIVSVLSVPLFGTQYTEFKSAITDGALRYVNNSGICETTTGVHTMSGYVDISSTMHTWFWFFAARNNPSTAPFLLWLNGGPGCSSMIGLFQEHGPCTVNSDGKTTKLNPYSWNEVANVIYIDQPIGTGFSYGTDTVTDTEQAAVQVWQAFQLLFESSEFSSYQSREFILATESYGGHYGPGFASYFESQNALIKSGKLTGEIINLGALMVNNGWIDATIQNQAYITFAQNAPGYGQISTSSAIKSAQSHAAQCQSYNKACDASGPSNVTTPSSSSNSACKTAVNYCDEYIFDALIGDWDVYDVREPSNDPYPPEYYVTYLQTSSVQTAIGAQQKYQECPDAPYEKFSTTGDDARSWLPQLSALADSKLKILIWAGDADYICNWVGVHEVVQAMTWYGASTLANTPMTNITVSGKVAAAVQNVDNFSFARVYGAGHEVPYYQPAAALAILQQVIAGEQLHSV